MTPDVFMEKSDQALLSAQALLTGGDSDGACSRAYYAMFNAARAALMVCGAPPEAQNAKTHRGLQSAFNQYLIKSGKLPKILGADFHRAEEFRLVGDYGDGHVPAKDTAGVLAGAKKFVDAVAGFILKTGIEAG
jgi:uncharacterized protein (UPF0332 family)